MITAFLQSFYKHLVIVLQIVCNDVTEYLSRHYESSVVLRHENRDRKRTDRPRLREAPPTRKGRLILLKINNKAHAKTLS